METSDFPVSELCWRTRKTFFRTTNGHGMDCQPLATYQGWSGHPAMDRLEMSHLVMSGFSPASSTCRQPDTSRIVSVGQDTASCCNANRDPFIYDSICHCALVHWIEIRGLEMEIQALENSNKHSADLQSITREKHVAIETHTPLFVCKIFSRIKFLPEKARMTSLQFYILPGKC